MYHILRNILESIGACLVEIHNFYPLSRRREVVEEEEEENAEEVVVVVVGGG